VLLQEVQGTSKTSKHDHASDLAEAFGVYGYEQGAYSRLTGVGGIELGAGPQSNNARKPHIGNAVFYLRSSWQKLDSGCIKFAQLLAGRCATQPRQCEHYTKGQQVAAWTKLLHLRTQRTVVIVSVHICANWRNPDTQLAQVETMMAELSRVCQDGDAILIGGDFNSTPTSGVYELLRLGRLAATHPDATPKNPEIPSLCGAAGFSTGGLVLQSAYAELQKAEPEFTTFIGSPPGREGQQLGFNGTLDYLWYAQGTLEPIARTALSLPTAEEASAEGGGLPNSEIPSDHVPLAAVFRFLPQEEELATPMCFLPGFCPC